MPERRIGRGNIDALRTVQCSNRSELQAGGPKSHDLFDVAEIGLAFLNPRRNPTSQVLRIRFDVRCQVKYLLAIKGKRPANSSYHFVARQKKSGRI